MTDAFHDVRWTFNARIPPASIRDTDEAAEWLTDLTTGVPDTLWSAVHQWLRDAVYDIADLWEVREFVEHRLPNGRQLAFNRNQSLTGEGALNTGDSSTMRSRRRAGHQRFTADRVSTDRLDAVDVVLREIDDDDRARDLGMILARAGHMYTVGTTDVPIGPDRTKQIYLLMRRLNDAEIAALADTVRNADEQVATYLRRAAASAYSRRPNPNTAVAEAVRAVERAAGQVITPNDPKPSLGKCIKAMRAKPAKWVTVDTEMAVAVTDDAPARHGSVADTMDALWKMRRAPHDQQEQPPDQTQPEAELAVSLAALLVRLLTSHVRWAPEEAESRPRSGPAPGGVGSR